MLESQTFFEQIYRIKDRNPNSRTFGQVLRYGREFARRVAQPHNDDFTWYEQRLDKLLPHLRLSDRVLIVGGGFGYLEYVMRRYGFMDVTTLDNSDYVVQNMVNEGESVDFLARSILDDVDDLDYDVVVTDFMVYTVARRDRETLYANCEAIAPKVIHLMMPFHTKMTHEWFEFQPLGVWQVEAPDHVWIEV